VNDTDKLLDDSAAAGVELRGKIETARILAVRTVRAIEDRLSSALDGVRLRGLPNLVPEWRGVSYAAARIRARHDTPLEEIEPGKADGHLALVLTAYGRLVMARRAIEFGHPVVVEVPATDAYLCAEDLWDFARILAIVLPTHTRLARYAGEKFDRISRLAGKLSAAISEE